MNNSSHKNDKRDGIVPSSGLLTTLGTDSTQILTGLAHLVRHFWPRTLAGDLPELPSRRWLKQAMK